MVKLNEVVRPVTVVINKTSLPDDAGELARLTWGAGQVGVAQGVLDCVADGTLPPEQADDLARAGRRCGSTARRTTRPR